MSDEAKMNPEPRACTCHPDDNPPRPCPRKYALRDCRIADVAMRLHVVADTVPTGDEVASVLRSLACRLEEVV